MARQPQTVASDTGTGSVRRSVRVDGRHVTTSPAVLVIGGGIIGAASAFHLARQGASVVLLEANELA